VQLPSPAHRVNAVCYVSDADRLLLCTSDPDHQAVKVWVARLRATADNAYRIDRDSLYEIHLSTEIPWNLRHNDMVGVASDSGGMTLWLAFQNQEKPATLCRFRVLGNSLKSRDTRARTAELQEQAELSDRSPELQAPISGINWTASGLQVLTRTQDRRQKLLANRLWLLPWGGGKETAILPGFGRGNDAVGFADAPGSLSVVFQNPVGGQWLIATIPKLYPATE
jgi:hypothetical protein